MPEKTGKSRYKYRSAACCFKAGLPKAKPRQLTPKLASVSGRQRGVHTKGFSTQRQRAENEKAGAVQQESGGWVAQRHYAPQTTTSISSLRLRSAQVIQLWLLIIQTRLIGLGLKQTVCEQEAEQK